MECWNDGERNSWQYHLSSFQFLSAGSVFAKEDQVSTIRYSKIPAFHYSVF